MLQYAAACYTVLQCVAVCRSGNGITRKTRHAAKIVSVVVACCSMCCSALQCVASVGGVLRRERDNKENKAKKARVTACCIVLQYVAVCFGLLVCCGVEGTIRKPRHR